MARVGLPVAFEMAATSRFFYRPEMQRPQVQNRNARWTFGAVACWCIWLLSVLCPPASNLASVAAVVRRR
jgi:hypothetical protein